MMQKSSKSKMTLKMLRESIYETNSDFAVVLQHASQHAALLFRVNQLRQRLPILDLAIATHLTTRLRSMASVTQTQTHASYPPVARLASRRPQSHHGPSLYLAGLTPMVAPQSTPS